MTALRLAVERGLENVTVEDITAEAGVSLRTFGNYFSSKYEAICAIGTDRARRIGATLLARPAGEPLWDAIAGAMLAHYESAPQAPDGEWMARLKLGGDRDQGVQGHLDGRAVAQAEGLISLPDPRINLWITLQGCHDRR